MNNKIITLTHEELIRYFQNNSNADYIISNQGINPRLIKNLCWQTWYPNYNNSIQLVPSDSLDTIKLCNTTGTYYTPQDVWYKKLIIPYNQTNSNSNFTYEYMDLTAYNKNNDLFYQEVQNQQENTEVVIETIIVPADSEEIEQNIPNENKIISLVLEGLMENAYAIVNEETIYLNDNLPRYFSNCDFNQIVISRGTKAMVYYKMT